MAVDDQTLDEAFGTLDPRWVSDDTQDPATRYIDVRVTRLYQDYLYGKPRGVVVDQGTATAKLRASLFSPTTGAPIIVQTGPYATAPVVGARYREASGFAATSLDAAGVLSNDGRTVAIDLPSVVVDLPGVHTLQFRIVDGGGIERVRNEVWVYVDRGLWGSDGGTPMESGALTTAEIRNAIRDHPGANRLLGEFEFDAAEIAMAVVASVQTFNAEFPPMPTKVSTVNWPVEWRWQLMDGVLSRMFDVAVAYHRRGMLPYSAGNVSINDLQKEMPYLQASQLYGQRFTKWCKFIRTSLSMRGGFASLGSGSSIGSSIY